MSEQGDNGGQQAEAQEQSGGIDLSPLMNQLGEITGRMDRFDASLQQLTAEPEPEPEQELDLSDLYSPEQDVDLRDVIAKLNETTEQRTQKAIEQAVAPLIEQVENMRADSDAHTLIAAYPELADPRVAEATVKGADQLAAELGLPPQLARRAGFIEMFYKAQKYEQSAAGEVPVGDLQHAVLEAGAGAAPQGHGGEPDIAAQIKAARSGNSFWGV